MAADHYGGLGAVIFLTSMALRRLPAGDRYLIAHPRLTVVGCICLLTINGPPRFRDATRKLVGSLVNRVIFFFFRSTPLISTS